MDFKYVGCNILSVAKIRILEILS